MRPHTACAMLPASLPSTLSGGDAPSGVPRSQEIGSALASGFGRDRFWSQLSAISTERPGGGAPAFPEKDFDGAGQNLEGFCRAGGILGAGAENPRAVPC